MKRTTKVRASVSLFPLFLKLRGRRCVVVGAGTISEGKIKGLLAAGAKVEVVAPRATQQIESWHRKRNLRWKRRAFEGGDISGAFLVVAATSSQKVHRKIYREARQRGVLCNIVDVPALCDFYYPAVVQRGELQIAISTAGASPSLAKRLREELEKEFGPEYALWLRHLARERNKIRLRKLPAKEQWRALQEEASEEAFAKFLGTLRGRARCNLKEPASGI